MSNELPNIPEQPTTQPSVLSIVSAVSGLITYFWYMITKMVTDNIILPGVLAFITAIVAIVTGHKGLREINRSNGTITGKRWAKTGLILGYIYIGLIVIGIILVIVLGAAIISSVRGALGA